MTDWLFTRQIIPGEEEAAQGFCAKGVRVDWATVVTSGLQNYVELCSGMRMHPAGPPGQIRANRDLLCALKSPHGRVQVTNSLVPMAASYKAPNLLLKTSTHALSALFSLSACVFEFQIVSPGGN